MQKHLIGLLTIFTLMFTTLVHAADDAAVTMLKSVVTEMTTSLDQQQAAIKQDPNTIVGIVNKVIVPHVDMNIMSKSVLARHWRTATETQRSQFQDVFGQWVVLTYSAAILNYKGQKI